MIYKILKFPDQRLRQKAVDVIDFDENLRIIVRNMYETMHANKGVGLAATQVDIHKKIITTFVDDTEITFINPELTIVDHSLQKFTEGCLSFPSVKIEKNRPSVVMVKYQDVEGNFKELTCNALLAVCIQHEIDHLKGITFIDSLSELKKSRVLKTYLKT